MAERRLKDRIIEQFWTAAGVLLWCVLAPLAGVVWMLDLIGVV